MPGKETTVLLTAEQLHANIERSKGEEAALTMVLSEKQKAKTILDEMENHIASGNLSAALLGFVEIQRIEYGLITKGLEERLNAIKAFLRGAETPIHVPVGSAPRGMKFPKL